ncbi:MAG: hypothetical protein ACRC2S_01885 [Waterburya sp.]
MQEYKIFKIFNFLKPQLSLTSGGEINANTSGTFAENIVQGNGGTISITTNNLGIFDGATISASSGEQGNGGLVDINANILS